MRSELELFISLKARAIAREQGLRGAEFEDLAADIRDFACKVLDIDEGIRAQAAIEDRHFGPDEEIH